MLTPNQLKTNDLVEIVSPSGAIDPELVESARKRLESWGLRVRIAPHALGKYHRFAAPDEDRIADLNRAIADPEVAAVWCSRGGYGLARIIERIDLKPLQKRPKWFIGFSDITVLHAALSAAGLCSLHAPMCKGLAGECPEEQLQQLHDCLFQRQLPQFGLPLLHPLPESAGRHFQGRLVGGNLSVLYGLRATPYDWNFAGNILFLEDLCEPLYHIDRMMRNLRLSGAFEQINGLILGQFTDLGEDDSFGNGVLDIVREATLGCPRYPIVYDYPAGHVPAHSPLMLGAQTDMQILENQSCKITFSV